jgi:hypothetical protein
VPIHFAPVLRTLEQALESNGLIQTLDSVGVTDIKAAEAVPATRLKVVPVAWNYIIRGTVYNAS